MNTNARPVETVCRVCGSAAARTAGVVEYFIGYAWPVFDCDACGCRFSPHDNAVYDRLHESGAISYYGHYREMTAAAKQFLDRGDLDGLRRYLSQTVKYRFIVEEIDRAPANARLLEVGCSRGYLTSYSILRGRNVLGIDVSAEAVDGATMAFGDHFALADSPRVKAGIPYDIIYHVGMIGCVADPIQLTKQLLAMLKPDGKLLFNAPNRAALWAGNQLWFDSAPPPDVVTLYPHGFWSRTFAGSADVQEEIEMCDSDRSFAIGLRKIFGRVWHPPKLHAFQKPEESPKTGLKIADRVWQWFERGMCKIARVTRLSRLAPRWPTEFGLFVTMTPK